MKTLIDTFNSVWDAIESDYTAIKRPRVDLDHQDHKIGMPNTLGRFPVKQYLDIALENAKMYGLKRIANNIQKTAPLLSWSQNSTYTEKKLGKHFLNNYVFGQLTGPGAPFLQELPFSGFLLIGNQTEYPVHTHESREVYLILTPGGVWFLEHKDWFPVSPGQVICHAPNQQHAMRTNSMPLLAFGAWLGVGDRNSIVI